MSRKPFSDLVAEVVAEKANGTNEAAWMFDRLRETFGYSIAARIHKHGASDAEVKNLLRQEIGWLMV